MQWGGLNWEIGINIHTLLCAKQIASESMLYSIGSSAQRFMMTSRGGMGYERHAQKGADMYTYS